MKMDCRQEGYIVCYVEICVYNWLRPSSPKAIECVQVVAAGTNFITHICRIKGCGGAGCPPPPIIFERLKLPQQIIYRRKENLSESPNHQKYWENILVSRFYEQFSRNRRNLGHFRKIEKNFKLSEYEHIIYHFEARDLEIPNI